MVQICIPTLGLWVVTFVDLGLRCMLIFGFVGLWCMLYSDVDFLGLWCLLIYGFVGLWCMLSESKSTTHLVKILNPEWNQVYAFSKDLIQASLGLVVHGGRKSGFEFCVFCVWFQSIRKSC